MDYKFVIASAALLLASSHQNTSIAAPKKTSQSEAELTSCIRTVMTLDEGTWAYMGTIARLNGKFRTYETTSMHSLAGPDTWSARSYGGDVSEEDSDEISIYKLVGAFVIPVENGSLNKEAAIKYTSCVGPDAAGRYETTQEYSLPQSDGSTLKSKNLSWYSEHGSYYVEDVMDESGRVVARRSGVNTPIDE